MNVLPTIAAGLGIAGAVLNASAPHAPALGGTKDAAAFLSQACWVIGNLLWVAYAHRTNQPPLMWQNLAYVLICGWGMWSWA